MIYKIFYFILSLWLKELFKYIIKTNSVLKVFIKIMLHKLKFFCQNSFIKFN